MTYMTSDTWCSTDFVIKPKVGLSEKDKIFADIVLESYYQKLMTSSISLSLFGYVSNLSSSAGELHISTQTVYRPEPKFLVNFYGKYNSILDFDYYATNSFDGYSAASNVEHVKRYADVANNTCYISFCDLIHMDWRKD